MSLSNARKRGGENNLFTTIRRKNIDNWFDRRSGNPIYDYGFDSPNYANATTNPQGLPAPYYIWGGGAEADDEIQEYLGDLEWNPGGGVDRYYVVYGKRCAVVGDLGGRGIIN